MIYWFSSSNVDKNLGCGWERFIKKNFSKCDIDEKSCSFKEDDFIFLFIESDRSNFNFHEMKEKPKVITLILKGMLQKNISITYIVNIADQFSDLYLVDDEILRKRFFWLSRKTVYLVDPIINSPLSHNPYSKNGKAIALCESNKPLTFNHYDIDVIHIDGCHEENFIDILETVKNYSFVIVYDEFIYSHYILLLVSSGTIIIDLTNNSFFKRCFPTLNNNLNKIPEIKSFIGYLLNDRKYYDFLVNQAFYSSQQYMAVNVVNRYANLIGMERIFLEDENCIVNYKENIKHIYGKKVINIERNEFCVFCLEKNGLFFFKEWFDHYRKLGARHFFIVDNVSDDGSSDFLKSQSDVTLFSSDLPFMYCESHIRNYIVSNYCNNMWCLSVDIDEFFDFPGSDKISMYEFLDYQNRCGYTAVVGNMLDMFSKEKISTEVNFIRALYNSYDVTDIKKNNYTLYLDQLCLSNRLNGNPFIAYAGGIRDSWCNLGKHHEYLLIKHPLTFQDGYLQPHVTPHFCDRANVSDVSCVLYHYKFVPSYANNIVKRVEHSNYFVSKEYLQYSHFYNENPGLHLDTENSKFLIDNNSIIDSKYFSISQKYYSYIRLLDK